LNQTLGLFLRLSHDLVRKPVSIFRDHALPGARGLTTNWVLVPGDTPALPE